MAEYFIDGYGLLQGPGVIHELIPEAWSQPIITPRLIIFHSNAAPRRTPWQSLIAYWRRADITGEAHLQANLDGTIVQAIPCNRRADCNYKANPFAISFETQDEGAATLAVTPWPLPQVTTLAGAVAAIGHHYGVPYTSPANWLDAGVGYHSQYPQWSSYVGKTCPGAARIRQMDWIRNTAAGICAC